MEISRITRVTSVNSPQTIESKIHLTMGLFFFNNSFNYNNLLSIIKKRELTYYNFEGLSNRDKNSLDAAVSCNMAYYTFKNYPLINEQSSFNTITIKIGKPAIKGESVNEELQQKTVNVTFCTWLNTLNGEVDFSNPIIKYELNNNGKLQCKLYFLYKKINNESVVGYSIPAVGIAVKNKNEFSALLYYLGFDLQKMEAEIFQTYKRTFDSIDSKTSNAKIATFYIATPRDIVEKIIVLANNNLDKIKTHFKCLLDGVVFQKIENALLNLMDILAYRPEEKASKAKFQIATTNFLTFLISNTNDEVSYFQKLYEKMNDTGGRENFTICMKKLYYFWKNSYYNTNSTIFDNSKYANAPRIFPYQNKRLLGFNENNTDTTFNKGEESITLAQHTYSPSPPEAGEFAPFETKSTLTYIYHYFQPIVAIALTEEGDIIESNITNDKLPLGRIMPAFYLKAIDDQLKWQNWSTAGWLALDIVTTFSGFGNIAKFRYLRSISQGIALAKNAAQAKQAASTVYKTIKLASGIVNITSGTVNALLKLSDKDNTKYGKAISNILILFEMAAFVGEITGALKRGLSKNAKEVLEHESEIRKAATTAEEIADIEKAFDELIRISVDIAQSEKQLSKMADDALNLIRAERPSACGVLQGNGMKFFNYSHKGGLPAGVFPKYKHPLVKKWVEEMWAKHLKGEIKLPEHHGKCAEIMNIDEYLHSIDPLGNIKTQEQAQKAFEGFVSHARQIDKNVIENHNTYKPACKSCISVLKDFGIKEYKIQ